MLRIERQAKIMQIVRHRGFVENRELAKYFGVTLATIRSDIKTLGKQNLVRIDHGGSGMHDIPNITAEPSYATKTFVARQTKQEIGEVACNFLQNGDTVVLDSGTTTGFIAHSLCATELRNITVITCDIMIAKILGESHNITTIVLGGQMRKSYYSTYGPYTEYVITNLQADKLFLGIDAANQTDISNIILDEVPVKQQLIKISKEVVLVTHSAKFDRSAPHRVCGWESIHRVITDNQIPSRFKDIFDRYKIPVHLVDSTDTFLRHGEDTISKDAGGK